MFGFFNNGISKASPPESYDGSDASDDNSYKSNNHKIHIIHLQ